MFESIIFDIDGTLVDSVDLHARAWQEAFERFGKSVSFDEMRHQIGKGGDQLLPDFLSREELDRLGDDLSDYRSTLFREKYLFRVRAFPKVRELFLRVKADGKRIALASSSEPENLEYYQEIAGISDLVEERTSAGDAEKSKPHPDIFQAALTRLGDPDPARVLVVGDTPYDAEAARPLGLSILGLLSGGFPEAELLSAGCLALYRDPADLLEHYDSSPLGRRA